MEWDNEEGVWVYDTVAIDDLASYLGVDSDHPDYTYINDCLIIGTILVQRLTNQNFPTRPVPSVVYKMAVLEVASEWYKRKDQGSSNGADFSTGAPVRAPKDVLTTIYPILRPWLPGGFA